MMPKEASQNEFQAFKEGYGISNSDYLAMENDIKLFTILNVLDKYRRDEVCAAENIEEFESKIEDVFSNLNAFNYW